MIFEFKNLGAITITFLILCTMVACHDIERVLVLEKALATNNTVIISGFRRGAPEGDYEHILVSKKWNIHFLDLGCDGPPPGMQGRVEAHQKKVSARFAKLHGDDWWEKFEKEVSEKGIELNKMLQDIAEAQDTVKSLRTYLKSQQCEITDFYYDTRIYQDTILTISMDGKNCQKELRERIRALVLSINPKTNEVKIFKRD